MYKINMMKTERTQRTKKIKQKHTNYPFKIGPVISESVLKRIKNDI